MIIQTVETFRIATRKQSIKDNLDTPLNKAVNQKANEKMDLHAEVQDTFELLQGGQIPENQWTQWYQ